MEDYKKKYEEAVKQMVADGQISQEVAEKYFPELKMSEDEKIRKYLLKLADRCPEDSIDFMGEIKKEDVITWLEKQGEQILANSAKTCKNEQKPAWSEEDENAIGMAIIALNDLYDEDSPDTTYGGYNLPFNKAAERLKSLRPQNTWKPSEKQMEALQMVCNLNSGTGAELMLLYNDLKKLM